MTDDTFKMQDVKSSNLKAIGHDPKTNTLRVHFQGGNIYHYHGVSAEKYAQLAASPSKGKHFVNHFKDKHPFKKQD